MSYSAKTPLSTTTLDADVVIIGAGVVGLALAIGLVKQGRQVVVLDAKAAATAVDWQAQLSKLDARVYALNLASIALLETLDVWGRIARCIDYQKMHVWAKDGMGELKFGDGLTLLGGMVEPSVLGFALDTRAQAADMTDRLQVRYGVTVQDLERQRMGWRVFFMQDGQRRQLDARLIVGADGRNSPTRQRLGIGLSTLDYHQVALTCAIRTALPHAHTARQLMLPTGTLALLPIVNPPDQMDKHAGCWQSVVWTLPKVQGQAYLQAPTAVVQRDLAQASQYVLGEIYELRALTGFALSAQLAKTQAGDDWVLVGDAAHGVHPLAGQGLNLGLGDVASLLNVLTDLSLGVPSTRHASDIAYYQKPLARALSAHARARHTKSALMMHSFSALNWLYAGSLANVPAMQLFRNTGFAWVGRKPWLLDFFARQANA